MESRVRGPSPGRGVMRTAAGVVLLGLGSLLLAAAAAYYVYGAVADARLDQLSYSADRSSGPHDLPTQRALTGPSTANYGSERYVPGSRDGGSARCHSAARRTGTDVTARGESGRPSVFGGCPVRLARRRAKLSIGGGGADRLGQEGSHAGRGPGGSNAEPRPGGGSWDRVAGPSLRAAPMTPASPLSRALRRQRWAIPGRAARRRCRCFPRK